MRVFYLAAGAIALGGVPVGVAAHDMPGMDMPAADEAPATHDAHSMIMTGAFGSYPMTREASGTAWQPDSSEHEALHVMSGDWILMAHGVVNLVYDHQSGRRGDDKAFAS